MSQEIICLNIKTKDTNTISSLGRLLYLSRLVQCGSLEGIMMRCTVTQFQLPTNTRETMLNLRNQLVCRKTIQHKPLHGGILKNMKDYSSHFLALHSPPSIQLKCSTQCKIEVDPEVIKLGKLQSKDTLFISMELLFIG